jgi:hypothetical protein
MIRLMVALVVAAVLVGCSENTVQTQTASIFEQFKTDSIWYSVDSSEHAVSIPRPLPLPYHLLNTWKFTGDNVELTVQKIIKLDSIDLWQSVAYTTYYGPVVSGEDHFTDYYLNSYIPDSSFVPCITESEIFNILQLTDSTAIMVSSLPCRDTVKMFKVLPITLWQAIEGN